MDFRKSRKFRIQLKRCFESLKPHALLIMTFFAVLIGLVSGFLLKRFNPSPETIMLISFPGEILMRMLKMLVLPLIISSLVTGVAVLDPKSSGKIGLYSMAYYMLTTIFASILGIFLVILIKPGSKESNLINQLETHKNHISTQDTLLDLVRNIFPENLVQATIHQGQTYYAFENKPYFHYFNVSNQSEVQLIKKKWAFKYHENTNILGIIAFCVIFGVIMSNMGRKAEILLHLFLVFNEIIMRLVMMVMWFAPFGITSLITGKILEIDDIQKTAQELGMYMSTVFIGLIIHCFITLPLIYVIFTRKNPYKFYYGCLEAVLTGIATSSSSATLPLTLRCLEENLGIDSRITRFVLPIGATINMDGTALYEAVAPIFIAQINQIHLSFVQYLIISLTATIASIGAASIPSAGLVTMVIVLQSVGLPVKDLGLILAVDFLVDRLRTAVNILGDSIGAAVVYELSKADLALDDFDEEEDERSKERIV